MIVDAAKPDDPLNARYKFAIHRAQHGAHDNELKRQRFYVMQQLAEHALRRSIGDVVECGCWHGHSTLMLEEIVKLIDSTHGRLHVFDSFEGLSDFGTCDVSPRFPTWREVEEVTESFRSDFNRLNTLIDKSVTKLHRGWIPQVFGGFTSEKLIAFAHIDVDLYQPTLDSLQFVYPRLVEGGVVFLDDYGYSDVFPGATLAVDRFLEQHQPTMFVKLPMGSAFLIK